MYDNLFLVGLKLPGKRRVPITVMTFLLDCFCRLLDNHCIIVCNELVCNFVHAFDDCISNKVFSMLCFTDSSSTGQSSAHGAGELFPPAAQISQPTQDVTAEHHTGTLFRMM